MKAVALQDSPEDALYELAIWLFAVSIFADTPEKRQYTYWPRDCDTLRALAASSATITSAWIRLLAPACTRALPSPPA